MKIRIALLFFMSLGLVACSGDPVETLSNDDTATDTDDIDLGAETNVTFLPLMTIEQFEDWNAAEVSDVFLSYGRSPWITYYTINPLNASTGLPVTGATASDFNIIEDGIPVNPDVSFPMLQPIVGNQINLRTAIIINTSSAMDAVDRDAFIAEIKDYVEAAKASSINHIKDQEFTVWGYSGNAVEETGDATAVEATVLAAIDSVNTKWANGSYEVGGSNHTYDAIVQAIGRYNGAGEFTTSLDLMFRDANTGEDNDLIEYVTPDYITASSIIVFSAGFSATQRFGSQFAQDAIDSQAATIYESGVSPAGATTEVVRLGKPFIYVIPDGETADSILSGKASAVIRNTVSGGEYSFAGEVLAAQVNAIANRFALGNQHVLRWASAIRSGEKHSLEVSTRTADDKLGYTLTVDDYGIDGIDPDPMPDPQVEITGANNEYIATNAIAATYDAATTYANLISTFYPATRWTNQSFDSNDYVWTYPAGSMTENGDGSVTIDGNYPSGSYPITLTLTNNNIQHNGATVTDTFTLTIQESN